MPTNTDHFISHLESMDRSPHTIQAYQSDLQQFSEWFGQTNGDDVQPKLITP